MYEIKPLYTIKHHGAVNGVTGSCHQLSLDGSGFADKKISLCFNLLRVVSG
jgi:hypothetical protein